VVRWTLLGIGALALACSSDGDNNSPFGVATSPGTTATATASASGGSTGEGTGSSSGGDTDAGESSTGGAGSTSGDPTTAETTDLGTSSAGTTMSGEETGDVPTGMQPVDGLYSHCLTGRECDPIPALCITINDMNDTPIDGFCSITPCTNAAVDCVPTPGGTALPACMPVTLDGTPTNACALDCSGGATCPAGMTCQNLTVGMICA
jgi:hypothetical protein